MPRLPKASILNTLSAMRVQWTDETDALLSIAVAMVMVRFKRTEITFHLSDIPDFVSRYEVDRIVVDDPAAGKLLRFTVKDRREKDVT